jgi:hypothetical protein
MLAAGQVPGSLMAGRWRKAAARARALPFRPPGAASTIEFLGPVAIAAAGAWASRNLTELLCAAAARAPDNLETPLIAGINPSTPSARPWSATSWRWNQS